MLAFLDRGRIVHLEAPRIAVVIGQRHEQIEPVPRRQQRGGGLGRFAHAGCRVVHQLGHAAAVERRLEPARAYQQRQFAPHLGVAELVDAAERGKAPQKRAHEPFAARLGAGFGRQNLRHVGAVEPQIAQIAGAQIVGEGARHHGAVDAARRRARDDVDDDAQIDLAADLAQQFVIDRFGVVFRVGEIELVGEARARPGGAVDRVQRARGADQLDDFLADPVDIDRQRNAAETYQGDAKFFFAQTEISWPNPRQIILGDRHR